VVDVILIVLGVLIIVNYLIIWLFYRKFKSVYDDFARKIQEIGLENELSSVFASNSTQNDILRITNDLFGRIKQTYNINANSYSEIVSYLKQNQSMDENLRNMLVDYFETVTIISYRSHSITDSERAEIKSKLKQIIKMLPNESGRIEEMTARA
jgi:hypothetical protein